MTVDSAVRSAKGPSSSGVSTLVPLSPALLPSWAEGAGVRSRKNTHLKVNSASLYLTLRVSAPAT